METLLAVAEDVEEVAKVLEVGWEVAKEGVEVARVMVVWSILVPDQTPDQSYRVTRVCKSRCWLGKDRVPGPFKGHLGPLKDSPGP